MPNDRLASYNDVKAFLKGGEDIPAQSEKYNALQYILDGVSRKIETYCLRSVVSSWLQQTFTELYGIEHYGRHSRDTIRLKNTPVVSITSVTDNMPAGASVVDPSEYTTEPNAGIIYRVVGKFYCAPLAVQVIYVAGYAATGLGDTYAIQVPVDVRNACLEQVAYELSLREPGGPLYGVDSISRPDGSIVQKTTDLLSSVKFALEPYRRK